MYFIQLIVGLMMTGLYDGVGDTSTGVRFSRIWRIAVWMRWWGGRVGIVFGEGFGGCSF
jgi:hypothetical protein